MALSRELCHIVCFGNEWHGDDGFGVRVYERLRRRAWPKNVEVFNGGITGLGALRFLERCSHAILVDALVNSGDPGEVRVLRPEDLADRCRQSLDHDAGLPYLVEALRVIRDPSPNILIVGAEIETIQPFSQGLSSAVEQAVQETVRLIPSLLPA